jgi:hypothetical protein
MECDPRVSKPFEVSRRQLLRNTTIIAGGAAVLATIESSERAEAGQMTKQAAGYLPTPKGDQQCENCSLFQAPSSCKIVSGDISPSGWCRLYVKKSA